MDAILQKNLVFERKNLYKALGAGLLTLLVLFGILWVWFAMLGMFTPTEEKKYELVGIMGQADFGNRVEGSGEVNNFLDPSPNPGDGTPGQSQPNPNQVTASNNPVVENPVIVKQEPSNTQASNNTNPNTSNNSSSNSNSDQQGTGGTDTGSGSNDGNSGNIGNMGDPNAHVLNDDGMFAFAGMGGRKYLDLSRPVYTAQQEAKLTFEFIIAPEGHVKYVKPPVTSNTALKKAGMDAIYKWKFEPIDGGADQNSKVTITFRLK